MKCVMFLVVAISGCLPGIAIKIETTDEIPTTESTTNETTSEPDEVPIDTATTTTTDDTAVDDVAMLRIAADIVAPPRGTDFDTVEETTMVGQFFYQDGSPLTPTEEVLIVTDDPYGYVGWYGDDRFPEGGRFCYNALWDMLAADELLMAAYFNDAGECVKQGLHHRVWVETVLIDTEAVETDAGDCMICTL